MTSVRKRTRGLAAAAAVVLLLGLAACGGGNSDDKKDSSSGVPTQDPSVKFTGDPVTVMTVSTYDTDYVLVKDADLVRAVAALEARGWSISAPRA